MLRFYRVAYVIVAVCNVMLSSRLIAQTAPQTPVVAGSNLETSGTNDVDSQLRLHMMQMLDQLIPYRAVENVSGKAALRGSITMSDLGSQWARNFLQFHPEVQFEGKAEGSEVALKSLAEDPKVIAGVSRPVDELDLRMLLAGKCKQPVAITIGMDALALYVHKDNPLAGVSPELLKNIFVATEDGKPKAKVWGDVGVKGALENQPIVAYERDASSGTQAFVSKALLGGAKISAGHKECPSNSAICDAIAKDPQGVGFADMNSHHTDVRRLPVLVQGVPVEPNDVNVLTGKYPFVRPLLLVLDKNELKGDGKLREAVLRYVLSRDGQAVVMKSGFYPLDPGFIHQQLQELFGEQVR